MSGPAEQLLPIENIDVGGLIRRPRPSRVAVIAKSIADRGDIETPIEVSSTTDAERYSLTCGWVRLEALRSLGRTHVRAVVRRAGNRERLQRQIDDNLIQDGCTVLDRAIYLAEGKALYEEAHPETRHGGNRTTGQVGHLPYHAWAAEQYALAERSIRRGCMIGEALERRAAELLSPTAWADHQQALEQVSRLGPDAQLAVARLLTRQPNPVESVSEAVEAVVGIAPATDEKKRYSAAFSNFAAMGARERKSWMRQVVEDDLVPPGVVVTFEGGA